MLLHPNSIAFTRAQLQTNKNPLPPSERGGNLWGKIGQGLTLWVNWVEINFYSQLFSYNSPTKNLCERSSTLPPPIIHVLNNQHVR